MLITLKRSDSSDEGTFGSLVYPGGSAVTIELPDRGNRRNLSRIPPGRYALQMRHSPRYGDVYEVRGVPNRNHILLHHGNFAGDSARGLRTHSAGCILLGSRRGRLHGQAAVLASRTARRHFEDAMKWEPATLQILDPGQAIEKPQSAWAQFSALFKWSK